MINFYAIPASLYCAKTRICLRHKHLIWTELPPPGGFGSDVYTSHIPSGTLPGLIDGETTLGDSEAIAEYLEEAYPSFPMLPKTINDRAKIRELSQFHDTRLEPCIRALFAHVPKKKTGPSVSGRALKINLKPDQTTGNPVAQQAKIRPLLRRLRLSRDLCLD
jgi:glutathione S-transferase